eukprot:14569490-Alexandrium_andersonii.AAC.1
MPYMLSESGSGSSSSSGSQPREQGEAKKAVEKFFGDLFSSEVEDDDLPMRPSTWLSPVSQLQASGGRA